LYTTISLPNLLTHSSPSPSDLDTLLLECSFVKLRQTSTLVVACLDTRTITCQDALILAGVLAQCAALSHLNLERNYIRGVGAGWLAPVLVQCTLSWLSLGSNEIGDEVRAGLREC